MSPYELAPVAAMISAGVLLPVLIARLWSWTQEMI